MQCFVATKKGTQCAHGITSGYTFTWMQYMVRTCAQHGEMIHHGTLILSTTTVVYKGEALLSPAHAVCEALTLPMDEPITTYATPTHTKGVRCGACSTHDAPVYHAHVDDVRACYAVLRRDTTPVPVRTHMGSMRTPPPVPMGTTPTMPRTTKAILCGACKQYHPTKEMVQQCYLIKHNTQ